MIPDEADSEQRAAGGSNPVDPVMDPMVGSHCRAKGPDRVHTGSGQRSSETTAGTRQHTENRLNCVPLNF